MKRYIFTLLGALILSTNIIAAPNITGKPVIISPEHLLNWPSDFKKTAPNLTEPTSNRLNDLHGELGGCDLVLSTSGNYHMALKEIWQKDLVKRSLIKNWFYTTSPPISPDQATTKTVQFGNLSLNCNPNVAVGPKKIINRLKKANLTVGEPVKIIKNQGNVILVKKGNPKNIKSIWDLGRKDVTVVTPNPLSERGSFGNFSNTIYNIALNDLTPPKNMNATKLFNSIFNTDQKKCDVILKTCKWVSGKRIMHREQPWAINSNKADAGVIFYHTALYIKNAFPDKFDVVMLGGTIKNPTPLKGNKIGVLQAVRLKGDWSNSQLAATEILMGSLTSDRFTQILKKYGINRP